MASSFGRSAFLSNADSASQRTCISPPASTLPSFVLASGRLIYPINKTDFDIVRFAHFLALAVATLRFVPSGWGGLQSRWLPPLILCGHYSLQVFALGIALSFAGYALLMELDAGVALHVVVGASGILITYGVARTFTWYKRAMTGASAPRQLAAREL